MSRAGAVAILVANKDRLAGDHGDASSSAARTAIQAQIEEIKHLILDVRAGRVDAVRTDRLEIIVKD